MPGDNSAVGSAPHARGTPPGGDRSRKRARFSPACAGNTKSITAACAAWSVQPRMRGEHPSSARSRAASAGSAPHARGTRLPLGSVPACPRFSPACAGNTSKKPSSAKPSPVQPRMRGEHGPAIVRQEELDGSAPHARGTLFVCAPCGPRLSRCQRTLPMRSAFIRTLRDRRKTVH